MTRFSPFALLLLALAVLAAPGATRAAEDYGNCHAFITSLPAIIDTSGTWCMNQNLSIAATSGTAITITADDVTIDCNDFKIDGLAAGTGTQTAGIGANNSSNVTVRHCNLRGFKYAVNLVGTFSGKHVIEDNRFDGNTFIAIYLEGDGSIIRRNRVFDTGGTTTTINAYGIYGNSTGASMDILDNTVSGVVARTGGNGNAYGIRTEGATGSVSGNRVRGVVKDGTGEADGIYVNNSVRVNMRKNEVTGGGLYGLVCASSNSRAKDNVINGFTTGIINCADDGNVIKP